ncbi:hypothetical protein AAVH_42926 [Aphelenchoides avenae]|nr:hypothetical protein AAVH_42926 [Aphelenchus avenae]
MRNENASEAVSNAESAGADDDDYEEIMLKKRKLEKRLSSQDRTAGHGSGSLMEIKTSALRNHSNGGVQKGRHAGLAVVVKKNRTHESLLDDKLMYHLNENISR